MITNRLHLINSIRFCLFLFCIICQNQPIFGQFSQPLFIPDTLTGPIFQLQIRQSVHSFFPGTTTSTLSFAPHTYLGPTIFLRRGWSVQASVENQLGDSTTLHWHGLHVPAHADGGPHSHILPGGQWNAHFTCLDKASTYWYHPHFHGKTGEQTLKGAAGMIIVRDAEEATRSLPRKYGKDDFPLIIQSLQFGPKDEIRPRDFQDSVVLVNGVVLPYLEVPAQWVRFRLVNASNARNFRIGFSDNQPFQLIGTDGGLLGRPLPLTRMDLAPGERVELLFNFQNLEGDSIFLKSYGSEISAGVQGGPIGFVPPGTPPMESPLNGVDFSILKFKVGQMLPNPVLTISDTLAAQTRLLESQAQETRTVRFSPQEPGSWAGPFLINDSIFDMNRIDFQVEVGKKEIWNIHNQTPIAHPFHMHGFSFYVLDRYGVEVEPEERGRKDVVIAHPNEQLRIIADFSDFSDPTMPYMFHCHLLSHEDDGMMGQFVVVSPVKIGAQEVQKTGLIFPNPVQDQIHIQLPENESWTIFNSLGKVIADGKGAHFQAISQWNAGFYFLKTAHVTHKFIKIAR